MTITVEIKSSEVIGSLSSPEDYFNFIEGKLKAARIPIDGDNLLYGTLTRYDNPENFDSSIWVWHDL